MMKGKYVGEKNPFFGKVHSNESKEKLRKSRDGINGEQIWNYRGKKILSKNGEVVGIFNNSKEVAEFIGCSDSNVRHVLQGKQKTAKGYEIKHSE